MSDANPWMAERYAELAGFEGDWRDSWWNPDFIELMARRWRLGEVRRALDVGCGAGHWGQMLSRHFPPGASLVGIDHEPAFATAAADRAVKSPTNVEFEYRAAKVESLPFDDESFDLVTCQTVLIHVPDAATAIAEMVRVLEPGGLLAVAEPNNLASGLAFGWTVPRPAFADLLELVRMQQVCEQGKIASGSGDSSIGDRIPWLFRKAGLRDIRTYQNDNCATVLPPYETAAEKVTLEMELGFADKELWAGGGGKEDTRRFYLAGGGDPNAFEADWARVLAQMRQFASAVRAGELEGARGLIHYLVGGRKPARG